MGSIVSRIVVEVLEWNKEGTLKLTKVVLRFLFSRGTIIGHFDGAKKNGWCGSGMVLKLKEEHYIKLKMGFGKGTTITTNLISLWDLLWFGNMRGFL